MQTAFISWSSIWYSSSRLTMAILFVIVSDWSKKVSMLDLTSSRSKIFQGVARKPVWYIYTCKRKTHISLYALKYCQNLWTTSSLSYSIIKKRWYSLNRAASLSILTNYCSHSAIRSTITEASVRGCLVRAYSELREQEILGIIFLTYSWA